MLFSERYGYSRYFPALDGRGNHNNFLSLDGRGNYTNFPSLDGRGLRGG